MDFGKNLDTCLENTTSKKHAESNISKESKQHYIKWQHIIPSQTCSMKSFCMNVADKVKTKGAMLYVRHTYAAEM